MRNFLSKCILSLGALALMPTGHAAPIESLPGGFSVPVAAFNINSGALRVEPGYRWSSTNQFAVFGWTNGYGFNVNGSWSGLPPMIGLNTAASGQSMRIDFDFPVAAFLAELAWSNGFTPPAKMSVYGVTGNLLESQTFPAFMPTKPFFRGFAYPADIIKTVVFEGSFIGARNVSFSRGVQAPTALAGPDMTVPEGTLVRLTGAGSDPQGQALTYAWTQIAGQPVTLSSNTAPSPFFQAPWVDANTTLTFQLVVTDSTGNSSQPDTVNIGIQQNNNAPVADAGDASTIKEGTLKTLDGSKSYDPDAGDTIVSYAWTQTAGPAVSQFTGTGVKPTFVAPVVSTNNQVLTFSLRVFDGKEWSAASSVNVTVVQNSAPVANAGADVTLNENAAGSLNASASSDPDNDGISFKWVQTSGPAVTLSSATAANPTFTAPWVSTGGAALGFELTVTDNDSINPKSAKDSVIVNVLNANDPPNCSLAKASIDTIWPPNHALVPVTITGISDPDATGFALRINSVTQDEPTNGLGDGDTAPDAAIQQGATAESVLLRAERAGNGNGRVYKVNFTASDPEGYCNGSVKVYVPRDRKATAVEDAQNYNALTQ